MRLTNTILQQQKTIVPSEEKKTSNTPFTNSIMRIISALFGRKIEMGPE